MTTRSLVGRVEDGVIEERVGHVRERLNSSGIGRISDAQNLITHATRGERSGGHSQNILQRSRFGEVVHWGSVEKKRHAPGARSELPSSTAGNGLTPKCDREVRKFWRDCPASSSPGFWLEWPIS
jgi:hypothetical protein